MVAKLYDVTPNASKLIDSMRFLGYDNKTALCDIIDNSIDAGAKNVWLNITRLEKDNFEIEIIDDGSGMDAETLSEALRFGSRTKRSARADLGRFGMGLTTASISMGRVIHVVTKTEKGDLLSATLDINLMQENNNFELKHFGPASLGDSLDFDMKVKHNSGTIVRISNTDGFRRMYVGSFQKDMIKHLGQIYRYFLRDRDNDRDNKVKMFVNDETVPINDPLWLDHEGTEEYSNELYEIRYKNEVTDQESEELIRIRLVILPDHGGPAENKRAGYNIEKSGFYILRNNREIASGETLGLIPRHPDFIRFRGEIFITGAQDHVMGIEFTKRDVKPNQAIKDQMQNHIAGDLKSIRKRIKRNIAQQSGASDEFIKAEQYISSLSRLLLTPPEKDPGDNNSTNNDFGSNPEKDKEEALNSVCKFTTRDMGEEGAIYQADQRGKIIYVELNTAHPFYKRFILDNTDADSRDKVLAAYYLIYSMAAAELRTLDEEQQQIIATFKTVLGINLRTLLSVK